MYIQSGNIFRHIHIFISCIQCTDTSDSAHPILCSLDCVLLRSYVTYVHQLWVSYLGSYMCLLFEIVLSGSYGYPTTCVSIEGVLVCVHVDHVFVEEGVLPGSYVYVHRLRVSSRVHMGNRGSTSRICVFVYITYCIFIYLV